MEPQISIHDNNIYGYSVDCRGRRIVLHTAFHDRQPSEYTDAVFTHVIAHHFEHVLESNILFDIEQISLEDFITQNADIFKLSWQHDWPPLKFRGDMAQLLSSLQSTNAQAFLIASSYGLSGWVLAKDLKLISRNAESQIL